MATNEMHTTREYVKINELAETARLCQQLLLGSP
jgi:acetylornithine deacetylase/succinyl-diaminopimelate desuccinylase-like protein